MGKKVDNKVGKVIHVDPFGVRGEQVSILKAYLQLAMTKSLKRGIKNAGVNGEEYWITFRYERISSLCYYCSLIGHDDKGCKWR